MIRATTVGTLKTYRSGLNKSFWKLNNARTTAQTYRTFNSYAEDPSAAALTFQLRRSRMTVESQITTCDSTYRKYQSAWKSLLAVVDDVDNQHDCMHDAALRALSDTTGDARRSLGRDLDVLADTLVQVMNDRYGDSFTFSGADGQTVPFSWGENNELLYRGVPVDAAVPEVEMEAPGSQAPAQYDKDGNPLPAGSTDPVFYKTADGELISKESYDKSVEDVEKLNYLSNEKYFLDIGLGNKEDGDDKLIESSAFNAALQGINFLGFGKDADGDPKNIISLVKRMAGICMNGDGQLSPAEWDELDRLTGKMETISENIHREHTAMDAASGKLKNNLDLLAGNYDTLTEQYTEIEDVDPADAISAFIWAQYSYNAALRVGNSVLAQSLMDYMQ